MKMDGNENKWMEKIDGNDTRINGNGWKWTSTQFRWNNMNKSYE